MIIHESIMAYGEGRTALSMLLDLAGAGKKEREAAEDGGWTVEKIINATDAMLQGVLSKKALSRVRMIPAVMAEYLKTEAVEGRLELHSPEKVAAHGRALLAGSPDEVFVVYHLTTKNRLIEAMIAGKGTVDQARIHVRTIIRRALELNSSSLILLHNHPSANTSVSDEDINLTKVVVDACAHFDIRVHDHVVIGSWGYSSLKEKGIMPTKTS